METKRAETEIVIEAATGRVRQGPTPIALSGRESDLALAIATRDHSATTSQLADMLYPDRDVLEAANLVKVYVFRLRKRVGADFILLRDGAYVVGSHVRVDLGEARTLIDLLTSADAVLSTAGAECAEVLARGLRCEPPARLGDYEWFNAIARRAHRAGRELALLLGRHAKREGRIADAMRLARELTFEDPCDEEAWELLIEAYLERGEHLAAIQGFRLYERVLKQELDVAPSPHLRALFA